MVTTRAFVRWIPVRAMNRPLQRACVVGTCATWRCACDNPVALQGRSGPTTGPTPDSVVRCERCHRVYFVIPDDKSHGPPIEVVELFGMPGAAPDDGVSARASASG